MIYVIDKMIQEIINTGSGRQDPARDIAKDFAKELYRIHEYADGLYFPDMKFRCGSLSNYAKTGILSEAEVEEI